MPPPDRLAGLVLAAGGSRRLGQPKQLVRYQGEALVRRAARQLLAVCATVRVVTGAHARQVEMQLEGLPVQVVRHAAWASGLGSSIAAGARDIGSGYAVLVMLCDQWAVGPDDLRALCETWRAQPERIACAHAEGVDGPPAIFPASCFDRLCTLNGDLGARSLLRSADSRRRVGMDGALLDLDDPATLALPGFMD